MVNSVCLPIIIATVTLLLVIETRPVSGNGGEPLANEIVQNRIHSPMDDLSRQQQITSMAPYKEPNRWIVSILRELFSDIDWQAIEKARVQIVKFIQKTDRMLGTVRSIMFKATTNATSSPDYSAPREHRQSEYNWSAWNKPSAAASLDSTSVKDMLERVACYVGYFRLMNLSNEALAELDASKVVTKLFESKKPHSNAWNWFG